MDPFFSMKSRAWQIASPWIFLNEIKGLSIEKRPRPFSRKSSSQSLRQRFDTRLRLSQLPSGRSFGPIYEMR